MPAYEMKTLVCDTPKCGSVESVGIGAHPKEAAPAWVPVYFRPEGQVTGEWRRSTKGNWFCPLCVAKLEEQQKQKPQLSPEQARIAQLEAELAAAKAGQAPKAAAPLTIPANPADAQANQGHVPVPQSGQPPIMAGQVQPQNHRAPLPEGPRPPILAPQTIGNAPQSAQAVSIDLLDQPLAQGDGGSKSAPLHPITEAARQRPPIEPSPIPPEVAAAFQGLGRK